jgi:hypothetical protein
LQRIFGFCRVFEKVEIAAARPLGSFFFFVIDEKKSKKRLGKECDNSFWHEEADYDTRRLFEGRQPLEGCCLAAHESVADVY